MIREMLIKARDGMKKTVGIWHAIKMRQAALTPVPPKNSIAMRS